MANENVTTSAETTATPETTQTVSNSPTVDELMAQLATERAERERNKLALDKALKEKGDITKQLRAKQTAEEQEAEAKAEADRIRNEEFEAIKAENNRMKAMNAYREISDEKVVESLIDAVSNADHNAIAEIIANECKTAVANAETTWINERPRVNAGVGSSGALTQKDIMAVKDATERQRLIAENIELFS